ncbi:MAG TPA: hypothetical protein ENO33_01850 [Hydrogenobaculum sp.]|nr:hypothetical protein [Hydrogenobaculum sp.]
MASNASKDIVENILGSWLSYIREEEKTTLCLEPKNIKDRQKFKVDKDSTRIEKRVEEGKEEDLLYIDFKEDIVNLLKEEIKKKMEASRDNEDISLEYTLALFPVKKEFKKENKKEVKICPILFQNQTIVIKKDQVSNIEQIIKDSLKNVYIDFASPSSKLIIAVSNLAYLAQIASKISHEEAVEQINSLMDEGESPLTVLEHVLSIESGNKSIKERIYGVLERLNKLENITDSFIMFDFNDMQNTTRHIKTFIENRLKEMDGFYDKKFKEDTPVFNYLFGKVEKNFEDYNTPSNTLWFGHATQFPLSKGQALVVQKLEEGENLLAVQGPPGTGKTTLLLNVIAWALTKRALEITKGRDFNNLILVSSTARKAVENAARDFEEVFQDKTLEKGFDFYSRFFLNLKSEETGANLEKVNAFLDNLDRNSYSEEEYNNAKESLELLIEILKLYTDIISNNQRINELEDDIDALNKKLEQLKLEEDDFWNTLAKEGITKEQFLEVSKKLKNKDLEASVKKLLDVENGKISELIKDLKELEYNLTKKKGFIKGFISKILPSDKDEFKDIYVKYRDIINVVGQPLDKSTLSSFLDKLSQIESFVTPNKKALRLTIENNLSEKYEKLINTKNALETKISKLNKEKEDLLKSNGSKLEKIENNYQQYSQMNKENLEPVDVKSQQDVFEFYREKLISINKLILKHSITILKQYALKEKEKLKQNLELFRDHFLQQNNKHQEIRTNLEDFYKYLSLAFPVVISTLHSSPKLFSGFDKVLISKNINPIYLSFVDESGMANVYLPFPIVSLSEKVVSVGDPLQLPPVVSLSESVINDYYENSFFYKMKNISEDEKLYYYNRYSPTKTSVYHRTARCDTGKFDDIGQAVFLDEHRRCQKPIAELFQKLAGYKNMNIKTTPISGDALEKLKKFTNEEGIHLMFYDVKGERGPTDKTNKGEVLAISNIIDNLIKAGYTEKDIGIITPFLDQEIYIRRSLGRYRNIEIGTVHKFQGKEFPVIIFSTVVFSEDQLGKVKFFNSSPNLLNVAISRAKHLFVVVGNLNILEKSGAYLKSMISFFKENKSCKVISNNQ